MAENGSNRKLYLVKNDSTTYVVGQTSSNLSLNDELLAASDKMDQWERYISGQKSWSASVTLNLSNNATDKQIEFIKSLVAGTPVDIFIGELKNDQQSDGTAGSAMVASVEDTFDKGALASRTVNLTGNGQPTIIYPAAS